MLAAQMAAIARSNATVVGAAKLYEPGLNRLARTFTMTRCSQGKQERLEAWPILHRDNRDATVRAGDCSSRAEDNTGLRLAIG
jgi:hypothetical protein